MHFYFTVAFAMLCKHQWHHLWSVETHVYICDVSICDYLIYLFLNIYYLIILWVLHIKFSITLSIRSNVKKKERHNHVLTEWELACHSNSLSLCIHTFYSIVENKSFGKCCVWQCTLWHVCFFLLLLLVFAW